MSFTTGELTESDIKKSNVKTTHANKKSAKVQVTHRRNKHYKNMAEEMSVGMTTAIQQVWPTWIADLYAVTNLQAKGYTPNYVNKLQTKSVLGTTSI